MSQHFLNRPQIRSVFKQVYRKRMAQGMRRDILFDSGLLLIMLDDLPEPLTTHPLTVHIDKQRFFIAIRNQMRPDIFYIILKRFDGGLIERDDPLLSLARANLPPDSNHQDPMKSVH